jgi:hypothetical protein
LVVEPRRMFQLSTWYGYDTSVLTLVGSRKWNELSNADTERWNADAARCSP